MKEKPSKPDQHSKGHVIKNPWGQVRSLREVMAKLERRGDTIVLAGPSNNTVSDQAHDYPLLYWDIRQLNQYTAQKHERGIEPTASEAMKDFGGTALCGDDQNPGYATRFELDCFLKTPTGPAAFAKMLIAKRWGMELSSVETNIKRGRRNRNKE